MTEYIFAYGSLMNQASRQLTGCSGAVIPASLSGFRRYWSQLEHDAPMAPLVVIPGDGRINGLLLAIQPEQLPDFDRREQGYSRVQVSPGSLTAITAPEAGSRIWIYCNSQVQVPDSRCPVLQTYADTVLAGCLSVSEEFARDFIRSTGYWEGEWVDDRGAPEYRNYAGVPAEVQQCIDILLHRG